MILEQSLIDPNFIGKDGFRWFIGQIPAGNSVSGGRCKVRIFGYHPADNQIKDKDLPWAHILVPPSFGSGAGQCGTNVNVKPGTYVFGFFIDGEDSQQPVIVGAFYDDPKFFNADSKDKYNEVLRKGTSSFKPFYGLDPRNSWIQPTDQKVKTSAVRPLVNGDNVGYGTAPGKPATSSSKGKQITENRGVVEVPSTCESGKKKLNGIQRALLKFIQVINNVQRIADTYINPALNTIANIAEEAKKAAQKIGDILIGIIRGVANKIIEEIYEKLTTFFGLPGIPPTVKLAKHAATETIIDSILCAIEKILNKIVGFVFDFLMNIVEDVITAPICAVESMVGELIGTISNIIDQTVGPLLSQVTSLIGGTFGTIMSYVEKSLSLARGVLSFLSCEESECYEGYDYEMNKGRSSVPDLNFNRILGFASASKLDSLSGGKDVASNWLSSVGIGENNSPYGIEGGECNASIIECGLPTVTLFGGGGSGASASAIVDSLGQIMGYAISSSGANYTSPPFVSIDSGCSGSGGAVAVANINSDGNVTSIEPIRVGKGYTGGSNFVGIITSVKIDNTGIGYTSGDTITSEGTDILIKPKLDDDGRIYSLDIVNPGSSITTYPILTINTQSGSGAILRPVLSFTPSGISSAGIAKTTIVYCSEL